MVQTFILFESPSGYALFEAKGVEGIALNSESIQQSIKKFDNFGKIVKLIAFSPFKSARDALENVNCISEGIVSETLKNFLETYFPKSKFGKKASTLLGVAHSSFCAQVKDATGIFCESSDVHTELIRGIRQHFSKFVKSHREGDLEKAQLGLGHSYSRAKVKFNVHRIDNMVIQAISLLDQLDKDLNKFAMRAKEWYGYHFPELARYCEDNHTYALCARAVGNRSHASDDSDVLEKLEEILHDSDKALQILRASKMSMGYDISDFDYIHIQMFLERVARLSEYRGELHVYLREKMNTVAPNLSGFFSVYNRPLWSFDAHILLRAYWRNCGSAADCAGGQPHQPVEMSRLHRADPRR
jgi:nucleolar protein 56